MATKTITIMNDAYNLLLKSKLNNESFSDVIRRKLKKKSIMDFAGAWKNISDETTESLKKDIEKIRKDMGRSLKKRTEVI